VGLTEMRVHRHNGLTPETERYRFSSYDDVSTRGEPSSRTSCFSYRQDGHSNHTQPQRVHYIIGAEQVK
jgi:hypothetical protein